MKNELNKFDRKSFWLSFVIIFVPQVLLILLNKEWQALLIFLCCSIFICLSFFNNNITDLHLGTTGVEIRMENALRKTKSKLNEADDTIDHLKKIALTMIKFNLSMMESSDYGFGSLDVEDKVDCYVTALEMKNKYDFKDVRLNQLLEEAKKSIKYGFEEKFDSIDSLKGKIKKGLIRSQNGFQISLENLKSEIENNVQANDKEIAMETFNELKNFLVNIGEYDDQVKK